MDTKLYLQLSAVMFLEYAVWGAWLPVLAARLLGPLKFNGKQTGWIYATLPIACIFMPFVGGQLADKWFNTEYILAVAHLLGAALLLIAAKQEKFRKLFITMLLYSFCFAVTLPLVNSVLFAHITDGKIRGWVFLWAPLAWALVGYFLTGWRWKFKTGEQGKDCLYLASILSLIMVLACCLILPATPPAKGPGMPIVKTLGMLKDVNFAIFIVISLVGSGMMQFYFLGTAQFMQDIGIAPKNVPASMAIAQAAQTLATVFLMMKMVEKTGFKWTLTIGTLSWFLLYVVYIMGRPTGLVVASQVLHGIAYVLFMIVGQIYADSVASPEIRSTMQALIFAATTGVGLFLCTQFAGIVMDKYRLEGKFQWKNIFMVPCAILAICILAFALFFKA